MRLHDLRHSFASALVNDGNRLYACSDCSAMQMQKQHNAMRILLGKL